MCAPAAEGAAPRLLADLSESRIAITSSFAGASLLLFGAKSGAGSVVVVVRGPSEAVVVRRKARIAGIWINRETRRFRDVPSYYAVATSAPLAKILPAATRRELRIGLAEIAPEPVERLTAADAKDYPEAIRRNKVREGLYLDAGEAVRVIDDTLFRTRIRFPATAPIGHYTAEVYLVNDGRIVARHLTALDIRKAGMERALYSLSQENPLGYGVLTVLLALAVGWIAAVAAPRS